MALIHDSLRDIVDTVNGINPVNLNFSNLHFSPVFPENEASLARMRVTASTQDTWRGSEVLVYHRLSLSKLTALVRIHPTLPYHPTLYELLPHLVRYLGITFTTDDLEDAPVFDFEGGYRVTVKAKETSHGWYGETEMKFYDLPHLSIPITELNIRW